MATYYGFKFKQRQHGPTFCLFHAPAGEILGWADIDRLEPGNTTGIQRRQNDYKIAAIKSFFGVDQTNTIPTAVVVAIQGAALTPVLLDPVMPFGELVRVNIPDPAPGAEKPGLVIDGQHRLLGIQASGGDLHIPVVAILDADDAEKAFQFVVINNKVSKVPADHIKALRLTYDAGAVSGRLEKVRLSIGSTLSAVKVADTADESPFKGMIDWQLNEKGARKVQPTAVEAAVAHIMQQQKLFEDKELAEQFFFSMWTVIRDEYKKAWDAPLDESKLCSKVGIICLTTYLTDNLVSFNRVTPTPIDLGDSAAVKAQVSAQLKYLPQEFWTTPWTLKSLDTTAGRQLVTQALAAVYDNVRALLPWNTDVKLIDIAQKPDTEAAS
jgi:DGQHR domain-containing protein